MRARASLAVLVLAAMLLAPAAAEAVEYDPVASGSTTLTFSASFSRTLAANHVEVEALAGAKRQGSKIVMRATGGEFDPLRGAGSVENEGTIVFVSGRRKVPFRTVVFKAKRSPLYAKVGGGQLKVASAKKLAFKREGFGIGFTASGLRLSAKVATRLDKKLRLPGVFAAGQEIGTIGSRVTPSTVHLLPANRVSVAIDPTFAAKLNKLFVSLNPIAPAELGPGPTLSFPIGGESNLAPDGSAGLIKTGGAVELLQLGSAQIFWQEPWLEPGLASIAAEADLEPSPPKPGKQARGQLLALATAGQVRAEPTARTIAVSGRGVTLTSATAEALNSSFAGGKAEFAAGESIGTLSFTAQGR